MAAHIQHFGLLQHQGCADNIPDALGVERLQNHVELLRRLVDKRAKLYIQHFLKLLQLRNGAVGDYGDIAAVCAGLTGGI